MLPAEVLTLLLYLVVLASGVSALVLMRPARPTGNKARGGKDWARRTTATGATTAPDPSDTCAPAPALVAHGAGVVVGSANAHRINADVLKAVVAAGSILVALIKLAGML